MPSIRAAYAFGADVVEIDVHLTPEDGFAVFHDWSVDCLTDGSGITHKQDMATLKALDIGYGYSAHGVTFPLRGTGVGLMPTLDEVLSTELARKVLINFKSNRPNVGAALAALLETGSNRRAVFGVYGGTRPTNVAWERPDRSSQVRQTRIGGMFGHLRADRLDRLGCVMRAVSQVVSTTQRHWPAHRKRFTGISEPTGWNLSVRCCVRRPKTDQMPI